MAFRKQQKSEPLASVTADPIVASSPLSTSQRLSKERKQELTTRKDSMERQEEEKESSPQTLPGRSGKCCIWFRKAPEQQRSISSRTSEPKMSVTAQLELTGPDRIVVLETMPWNNKVADNGGESTELSGDGREDATSMRLHSSGVSTTLVHSSYTTNSNTNNIQSSLNTNFASASLPQAAVTAGKFEKLGPPQPQHVQVVLGLDVMPRIGMLVQLSHEGRASFDERLLCLSGCDDGSGQGHITKILSDLNGIEGKVCLCEFVKMQLILDVITV